MQVYNELSGFRTYEQLPMAYNLSTGPQIPQLSVRY